MTEESDQARGEDAPSPRPTPHNDNAPHEGSGERPHVDEDAVIREGIEARRRLGRQVAQEALTDPAGLTPERLRRLGPEGLQRFIAELRRAGLGVAPAPRRREEYTPPGSGAEKPSSRQPSSSPSASAKLRGKTAAPGQGRALASTDGTRRSGTGRPAPRRVIHPPGSIEATSSNGWWRTNLHEGLPFEQWATIVGLLVGALAIVASLIWLARTRF